MQIVRKSNIKRKRKQALSVVVKNYLRATWVWKYIRKNYISEDDYLLVTYPMSERIKKMRKDAFSEIAKPPKKCNYTFVSIYPNEEIQSKVVNIIREHQEMSTSDINSVRKRSV